MEDSWSEYLRTPPYLREANAPLSSHFSCQSSGDGGESVVGFHENMDNEEGLFDDNDSHVVRPGPGPGCEAARSVNGANEWIQSLYYDTNERSNEMGYELFECDSIERPMKRQKTAFASYFDTSSDIDEDENENGNEYHCEEGNGCLTVDIDLANENQVGYTTAMGGNRNQNQNHDNNNNHYIPNQIESDQEEGGMYHTPINLHYHGQRRQSVDEDQGQSAPVLRGGEGSTMSGVNPHTPTLSLWSPRSTPRCMSSVFKKACLWSSYNTPLTSFKAKRRLHCPYP